MQKVAQVLAEESKSEGAATGWLMKRGVHPFNKELDESRWSEDDLVGGLEPDFFDFP